MRIKTCLFSVLLMLTSIVGRSQITVPLYQGAIPNAIVANNEEQKTDRSGGAYMLSKVSVPTLTFFAADTATSVGAAVVICPGGGYAGLSFAREGTDIAKAFNKIGVSAFVLKYRLPDDKTMADKSIGPLQDAQEAIKLLRENASKWNIDPNKVGIAGFSAGGHLASTAGTHFNLAQVDNPENTSLRPDFMVLIYPVISFSDSLTHMGSRDNLIGKNPLKEKILLYSNAEQVNNNTPPAFIVHAGDDAVVKVENSLKFYEALHRNHVIQSALLIYPKGGHGFGLNNGTIKNYWIEYCKTWMQSNGWIKKD